jgi:DNA-binding NarL/FixJ family response regulator
VLLVRSDMRIEYANAQAERLRRDAAGPFGSGGARLRAGDPEIDGALRALVGKMVSRRTSTAVLRIAHPGARARYIIVARLADRGGGRPQLHDAILDPGPVVMLVVHGVDEAAALPMDLLWRAFSLTEAEAGLAEALFRGTTLGDFAKERQVSKQTLRNQLVGVMRKTGTRRQAELVSLLTRLALTC